MEHIKSVFSKYFFPFVVLALFLFLYIPILVMVLFSFSASEFTLQWSSFSLRWYHELFASAEIWDALSNSLIVAFSAVALSLTMGVLLVFYSAQSRFFNKAFLLFYGNLAIPEIVLAVGLLSFIVFVSAPLGLSSLIAGHTLIGLGYVVPIIYSRFIELDDRYTEASLDLGATQGQTLIKVILPLLWPALVAAALLVFIISLDDFVLSFFCAGASTQTLPMYIFSMIRSGASPVVSALSTVLLVVSSILVLIFSSLQIKKSDLLR
jgi:spermidine/putrescine transport system permease protein